MTPEFAVLLLVGSIYIFKISQPLLFRRYILFKFECAANSIVPTKLPLLKEVSLPHNQSLMPRYNTLV
jgi:hypothetical protein